MKNNKMIKSHYLSISYKVLINNKIIHYILFILEMYLIMLQIMEIICNDFKPYNSNNIISFTPLTKLIIVVNSFPILGKFILYIIIIIFLTISSYILNTYRLRPNKCVGLLINISELIFYRILSLFIFNYLFSFDSQYLFINIIITVPFIITTTMNFYRNHLFSFFVNIINYPYDLFSMVIDLHLLVIQLFLSISLMNSNEKITKFFFVLSILLLFVLLIYLSYIMINKSYYLMNNFALNKVRYSTILAICIIIVFIIIIGNKELFTAYSGICYFNILVLCLLLICYFYNPYNYCNFDKDDNFENVLYYFFILDRDKNKYLLLEEKIEEHLSKCNNRCNLCQKYNNIKLKNNENDEKDLYYIISNGKNYTLNLMNNIIRGIRKNGRCSFFNKSYYLISIIYIYSINLIQKDFNGMMNTELMYEIINNENSQYLEDYRICLNRIKYTNNFLIKSKNIIDSLYQIFEEKKLDKKTEKFFKLGELLDDLEYNEIKSNLKNNVGIPNGNTIKVVFISPCKVIIFFSGHYF